MRDATELRALIAERNAMFDAGRMMDEQLKALTARILALRQELFPNGSMWSPEAAGVWNLREQIQTGECGEH